jgi:solute carrier family 15 (peptide/histidine transporter), member 3/4
MHACVNPQEGSWTPTAELPLRQGPAVDDDLPQVVVQEKQHGGGAAARTATATRDGSVGWSGKPCRRDKSGGWFAGFLMLGKST